MVRWNDRPAMTIAVDLGRKATKTKKKQIFYNLPAQLLVKMLKKLYEASLDVILPRE